MTDPSKIAFLLITNTLATLLCAGANACYIKANKSRFVRANVGMPFNSWFTNKFKVLNLSKLDLVRQRGSPYK